MDMFPPLLQFGIWVIIIKMSIIHTIAEYEIKTRGEVYKCLKFKESTFYLRFYCLRW